ncbi:hypothetical protein ACFL51_01315 [Myxococcota bacterium]
MRRPWEDFMLAVCFTLIAAMPFGLVAVFTRAETAGAVLHEAVRTISPMLAVV